MNRPALMPRDDGRYELVASYHEVPAGFVTDGASIPRFLWRVLGHPFEAATIGAAVRHDYAYQTGRVPREQADAEFHDNLRADGVGAVKAKLYYFGVRMFGARHYNNKQKGEP